MIITYYSQNCPALSACVTGGELNEKCFFVKVFCFEIFPALCIHTRISAHDTGGELNVVVQDVISLVAIRFGFNYICI